jgi:hypothetical protein
MQIISLTGNKEENYYQLGLKDKESAKPIFKVTSALLKSTNSVTNYIKNFSSSLIFKKNFSNYSLVKAYAQGLGVPENELISFLLTPDIISGMSAVIPKIPAFPFGCSSLMYLNSNGNTSHFRILDFPLAETYTDNERLINYSFQQEQKYNSLSTSGFPFPSITAMNESGLTFALHQKFGHIFNKNGIPIFDIMENLVSQARDIEEIKSELKYIKSISTWGIYISSQSEKKVLSIDLLGEQNNFEIKDIRENKPIYFNNKFLNTNIDMGHIQPLNFYNYCLEREKDALQRIKKIKKFDDQTVLKKMTSPPTQKITTSVMTPSSILSCTMNSGEAKILLNSGQGPRLYQEKILEIENLWVTPKIKEHDQKKHKVENKNINQLYHHLIQSQIHWDSKNYHQAIHHAQMAVSFSHKDQVLADFFLEIFISLSTSDKSLLKNSLKVFNDISHRLSGIFEDYCKLFIFRLEKICFLQEREQTFSNSYIREIYEFEKNIPKLIFQKVTRELTSPRIDIQDIIFLHPLKDQNTGIPL